MSFDCDFCKKKFSTKSILTNHQKTVKYCLEIQKNINKENVIEKIFQCNFCNKTFNLNNTLKNHVNICKNKKDVIIQNEIQSIIKEKDNEINIFKIRIKQLEKELKEKNNIINKLETEKSETNKYLLEQACSKNSIVNKNNYNIQYNNLLNELVPFNEENIKIRINQLDPSKIAFSNDKVSKAFISNLSDSVKDMAFCTDLSRGSLVIKHDEGSSEKITSKKFVLECFKKGKTDLIDACDKVHQFITDNPEINVYDQVEIRGELGTMITSFKENKLNSMVIATANKLVHDCKYLNKVCVKSKNSNEIMELQSDESNSLNNDNETDEDDEKY
jgi:hypothetical protein